MRRLAVLLLLLAMPARADPGSAPTRFSAPMVTDVFATALGFIVPRTLDPVSLPQLTVWGLRGLSALDPQLTPELREGSLRLIAPNRVLVSQPAPPSDHVEAWAQSAASLAGAASDASAAVRHAGTEGVIRSFFDELFNHLDPYSRYAPPAEAAADRARRSGESGAGLTLAQRGGAVVVQDVIADGPGDAAGIRAGDRILAVDDQPTRHADAATVDGWITGPEDTEVAISLRGRDGRTRTVTITRALVPPETVFASRVKDLLVLRVSGFSRSTGRRLAVALSEGLSVPAERHPPQGVVLDLRGNRGGLLRQAVAAADSLLGSGVVAITAGRNPAASHVWTADTAPVGEDLPMVVVVDGRSASAAEILAAALADHGRAVVVGSSTLGKGLVQTISPLPDGGELFVTWSRVLAPRGWPIQGLGVLPQVCTSLGQEELDRQLAELLQGRAPMARAIARARAARAPLPVAEILDIRSACPAAEGRDADLETAGRLIASPPAYAAALLPPMRDAGQ